MTTAWLIVAVAVGFFLLGIQTCALYYQRAIQKETVARLEGRIQGLGSQLRYLPKRKSDRDHES